MDAEQQYSCAMVTGAADWRKFIEAVKVMGPDKLIAGSGSSRD